MELSQFGQLGSELCGRERFVRPEIRFRHGLGHELMPELLSVSADHCVRRNSHRFKRMVKQCIALAWFGRELGKQFEQKGERLESK